jgi:hypothetical protein
MHATLLSRSRTLAAFVAAALLAAGCSGDSGTPTEPGTGELAVTVTGLPSGAPASVVVTGPNGYSQAVPHSTTLLNLAPGSYALAASTISAGDTSYVPDPPITKVTVTASANPVAATVAYSRTTSTLDLSIGAMYLTQSTQTLAGAVPLVQDRDGYLRVFVVANHSNSAAPQLRVRFYVNGALQGSPTIIAAPSGSVPTAIAEGVLASSWNMRVPGSMIRPGLAILADVDPAHAVAEVSRANNSFPASGTPLALTVHNLSPFYLRFVPVKQSTNNLVGNVSNSNKSAYVAKSLKIHPIASYDADVHAVYTTDAPTLTGDNANGAWGTILSEMQALHVAEGTGRTYYGVVRTAYTTGIVGMSYIGGNASLGYDGTTAYEIVSHELGHSFGRSHAPCGINGATDPNYPYAAGNIGAYGLDVATLTPYAPSTAEVMSYCHPQWISDYSYTGVYNYRLGHPTSASVVQAERERCMVVWGRIIDGQVELEPAFEAVTRPTLPARNGAYTLRAADSTGAPLFALSFDGDTTADAAGAGRGFAFAIPIARARRPIASLALAGPHGSARRAALPSGGAASSRALGGALPATARAVAGGVSLAWNAQRYPLMVVRDAATGEILSLARRGATNVATTARDLELTLSDGVRSTIVESHVAP